MKSEIKNCQNCHQDFIIEPDDFAFYEKMQVPPPTFCPACRMRRRFTFYNLNNLFNKTESLYGKKVFSTISEESPYKIYDTTDWWGDGWDPFEYGRDYDFSRPFFEQLREFFLEIPCPSRSIVNLKNSDYSANATGLKNCYLTFNAQNSEDCMYAVSMVNGKSVLDVFNLVDSELCYDCFSISNSYKTFYSNNCHDCQDVYLSKDLNNCRDCIACIGLSNKKYCIFNEQYSKEDYEKYLQDLNLGNRDNLRKMQEKAKKFFLTNPVRFMVGIKNQGAEGNYIDHSKNIKHSFFIKKSEDMKYSYNLIAGNGRDSMDQSSFGNGSELVYDSHQIGNNASRIKFSLLCFNGVSDLEYCMNCMSSSYLFACAGLRGKKYCIFNKQYTKEEYFNLIEKIKKHMDEMPYEDRVGNIYKYGEFLPPEFSTFAYNETVAQEFFPLDRERAEKLGYWWNEKKLSKHKTTILKDEIPVDIKDVSNDILNEVLECVHQGLCNDNCTKAFKITARELEFYIRFNIPIPDMCFYCRYRKRLEQRDPIDLWHRQCMCEEKGHNNHEGKCTVEFETSYAPDRPEIIYCEKCYQQEVY